MMYQSTKTYGNDRGLSCAFRQWRADSHCNLIHGYSLGFRFVFEATQLDKRNWVYDFGNCKWIKQFLEDNFDHTLAIDENDPELNVFMGLEKFNLANVVVMDGVGCEKFAEHVFSYVSPQISEQTNFRVRLYSVEVFEHGANSAICINPVSVYPIEEYKYI
tara:strand:- start:665 stop:1147 length:483 start_codon:yes stop_codon:yes gene_type:complete